MTDIIERLKEPEAHYPGNFDTPKRANAMLSCLCQEAMEEIESLRQQLEMAEACLAGDNALIVGLKNDIAEKDAKIERLKHERLLTADAIEELHESLRGERAASQASEQQLRDEKDELSMFLKAQRSEWHKAYEIAMLAQHRASALTTALNRVLESVIPYREDGEPSIPDSVIAVVNSALALPQDTTALEAMITKAGEVMRERCAVEIAETADMVGIIGHSDRECLQVAIRALPAVTFEDLK